MKKVTLYILIIFVCLFVFVLVSIFSKHSVGKLLSSFSAEESIPAYSVYNSLYWKDNYLSLNDTLKKYDINGLAEEILCVSDQNIWFVYSQANLLEPGQVWNLATVNLNGENFQLRYSGAFDSVYCRYHHCVADYFEEKNGYYWEQKIILTDHKRLIEYDISTNSFSEKEALNYSHPRLPVNASIEDFHKIVLTYNDKQRTIVPSYMAKANSQFAALLEHCAGKTLAGESRNKFLYDSVQTDGKHCYIVCGFMSFLGETYAVVFEYDPVNDVFDLSFSEFLGDTIDNRFYIVPEI